MRPAQKNNTPTVCRACQTLHLKSSGAHGGSTGALPTAHHCTRGHAWNRVHALSEFTEHRVPRATRTRRTSTSDVERQGRQRPGPASPLKGRSPRRSIRPPGSWVVSGGEWDRRLWRRLARDRVGLPMGVPSCPEPPNAPCAGASAVLRHLTKHGRSCSPVPPSCSSL